MGQIFISVFRNTSFRSLWFSQITSLIALNMLYFVLAISVYEATRSNAAVSFLFLTFGVPAIIFGIIAGGIVDYFDKRLILIFCNISRCIIFVLFFLLWQNLTAIYILSVLMSIVTQLFIPAEAPALPFLVPERFLLTANSLFAISFSLSTALGFVLAGPLLKLFGHTFIYLPMLILMGLAVYFVWFLPVISPNKTVRLYGAFISNIFKTLIEAFRFVRGNRRILNSLILMTFSQALIATLAVLAPGFADRVLTIDLTDASLFVMGPGAAGLVFGALLIGGYGSKFLKGSIILFGILAIGFILFILSLITQSPAGWLPVDNLVASVVLLFLLGNFNSFISVPANTILQEDSQEGMRSRIYGILTSATGGVSLLPVVFSGILADVAGVSTTLLVLGVSVIGMGVYQYLKRNTLTKHFKI